MSISEEIAIPCFVRRIVQTGPVPAQLNPRRRPGIEHLWTIPQGASPAKSEIAAGSIDCLIIAIAAGGPEQMVRQLDLHLALLAPDGQALLLFVAVAEPPADQEIIDQALLPYGLMRYHSGFLAIGDGAPAVWALTAVRAGYNPVVHARRIADLGRPDCAIAIVNAIPSTLIPDKETFARLTLEKQRHLFRWQEMCKAGPPYLLFSKARREFAQVTALNPTLWESYDLHARYWSYMGRSDMAERVRRSVAHVAPKAVLTAPSHPRPTNTRRIDDRQVPEWDGSLPAPRILVITHDFSDYGLDTLYHGLCNLLGESNVVEFPWKPTLHGQNREATVNYPCFFEHPGKPVAVETLARELGQGRFDLILYADVVQMAHREEVQRLMAAAPQVPVVLYDTWDDCYIPTQRILEYIGRPRLDLCFKREMLSGFDYGPRVFPLPFGYVEAFAPADESGTRTQPVFWAGKSDYGLRPLYIPALEKYLGRSFDQRYTQDEYRRVLADSQIGLSFFGCGFDTVRYWELPAHGVMLMAERPPIRIPHDFEDGHSAVFFDDLPQMLAKLEEYLKQPGQVRRIAANGRAHFMRYHTCTARARQFLGRVAQHLFGGRGVSTAADISDEAIGHAAVRRPGRPVPKAERLYLGLVKGEGYGWGICSRSLIDELSNLRPVSVLSDPDGNSNVNGPLFQALIDVNLTPMFPKARGWRNCGYTFFENELTAMSSENARQFDLVLGGSTWCRERLLEKGIENCGVLIQGIDPRLFYPIEEVKSPDDFVIFSGGKFELRKGQDLVLHAVRIMQEKYPDVRLINCWYNLWPASTRLMSYSRHIRFEQREGEAWEATMRRTYVQNGLNPERIETFELLPQEAQRALFARTDIGLFPNRCEGGTNLVLMEYMACGKPVIASNTSGHRDIVNSENALLLNRLSNYHVKDRDNRLIARWQEPSLEEIVAQLEYAYHNRAALRRIGQAAGAHLKQFTWRDSALSLLKMIDG